MSISPGTAVCQIVSAQIIDPTYDPSVWEHDCHKVATITHFDPTGATPSTGTLTTAFSTDINHPVTTLTGAIDAATLTIPVASVAGWAAYSWIVIDSEWMQIASVGASSLTVTSRGGYYTTAASHSNGATVARVVFWEWNTDYDATYRNITIRNSIWRDVAGGFNVLAKDRSGWGTDSVTNASRLANVAVTNNLIEDTFPNQLHNKAIAVYPQEQATAYQNTVSGNNISFEHNTFNWKTKPSSVMYWVADGFPLSLYSKINNFTMRSNLMPDVDPMNPYALGLSGGFYNTYTLLDHVTSGNQFFGYNQFNLVSTTCSTVDCTGALSGTTATDVIYTPGSYYVMDPSAPAYHAGYLGTNMGVDPTLLPAITSLTVTPLANTAMLQFTLNGPINAAGSTQPCMLEVSPQQNLRSYIGSSATVLPYTTTNDLNPAYFKQPDQSNRTNPLLPAVSVVGSTVTWQIGLAATVTGDDGNPHDLRLTPLTPYWGRLMCYGDTQNFSFVTTSLTAQTSVMFVGASKIVGRANVTSPGSPLSLSLLTDGALATLTNGPLATMVN